MKKTKEPDGRLNITAPPGLVRDVDTFRANLHLSGGAMVSRGRAALMLIRDGIARQEEKRAAEAPT